AVYDAWRAEEVMPAARRLFSEPISSSEVHAHYDAYHYQRHPEAMNGARSLGLPALQLDFNDAGETRVYIDLRTGDVAMSLDRAQHASRWLFYFLHSWDTPALLRA